MFLRSNPSHKDELEEKAIILSLGDSGVIVPDPDTADDDEIEEEDDDEDTDDIDEDALDALEDTEPVEAVIEPPSN